MTSAERVIVHPLVLLSVVDHYNRVGKVSSQKRVVGCLLGSMMKNGQLDVSNSFAGKFSNNSSLLPWIIVWTIVGAIVLTSVSSVPFDEDEKDADVYFLDHDYLEAMYTMFKKVNGEFY